MVLLVSDPITILDAMTKLATITINHNHGEMIRETIKSLFSTCEEVSFKSFVINNRVDAETTAWLKDNFPSVELIQNGHPRGFADNNNRFIESHPEFDYYLLLNPDVVCLPGMIGALLNTMEVHPEIGVSGPLLMNPDGSVQPNRRRFANIFVLALRILHLDAIFKHLPAVDHYLMHDTQFSDKTEVDWITGAVLLLRKAALDQVGLFDERFFLYFEDEDLCCRMWREGWKICYVPQAQAYHRHIAAGRKQLFSKENFTQLASAFKMFIKYRGKITR
jgi:GT2 family glycosyltransferase